MPASRLYYLLFAPPLLCGWRQGYGDSMRQQDDLFGNRMTVSQAVEMSLDNLRAYGDRYPVWSIAYSGGKDSSATVAFVAWAVRMGKVAAPERLIVLYADTRQELPPLHNTAMQVLARLRRDGFDARVVLPAMDKRFYVYMFGRGVPPPSNRFRWCTPGIKVQPMMDELQAIHGQYGHKILSITGVRLGESAARDQRITASCSRDSGECGQGWFQVSASEAIADTLSPLLHWRVCNVYDWLYFMNKQHGYPEVAGIADVYGEDDIRTGCVGCNLASRDNALERVIQQPQWAHLSPLLELRLLFAELKRSRNRLRKAEPEINKDGTYAKNGQRMGPLTMEARAYGLARVLDIQQRAGVDLINADEEARIRELWTLNTWPDGWDGDEIRADVLIAKINVVGSELITQPILLRE